MYEMTILEEMYSENEAKQFLAKAYIAPTVRDVLLKMWAHDTEAMQCAFVHKDMSGGYWYMTKNKHGMFCWMWTLDHSEAMEKQAEFLNSAAGKEKP